MAITKPIRINEGASRILLKLKISSLKNINKDSSFLNTNTSYLNAFGSLIGRKHAISKFYKKN